MEWGLVGGSDAGKSSDVPFTAETQRSAENAEKAKTGSGRIEVVASPEILRAQRKPKAEPETGFSAGIGFSARNRCR